MAAALESSLLAAEEARRLAMLAADTAALDTLLSDALAYTHSTGVTDSKASYLRLLANGALRYEALEFAAPQARLLGAGTTGLVSAVMRATILKGEVRRDIASSYLAVWEHTASGWVLQAVQATALPAKAA
ncbi:nuclear transport factor 2 family protein [Polaromonas sp. YR568]|uniref:nuclear transport factor 2 family protein n=1 Tax=Polaromonas sp. YR568 TaxID=1855301 RepID=UPI00398BE07F